MRNLFLIITAIFLFNTSVFSQLNKNAKYVKKNHKETYLEIRTQAINELGREEKKVVREINRQCNAFKEYINFTTQETYSFALAYLALKNHSNLKDDNKTVDWVGVADEYKILIKTASPETEKKQQEEIEKSFEEVRQQLIKKKDSLEMELKNQQSTD